MITKQSNKLTLHVQAVNDGCPPNHSLKLTEITAPDFAAQHQFTKRQNKTQFMATKGITTRAMSYDNQTARCRSLAPVR